MKRELPSRPSLEYLRKEAKQLLDRARSQDPEALESLRAVTTSGRPSLHHAQLALAREYGFSSWRDLAFRVRTTETDGFLSVVCGDRWDLVKRLKVPPEHVRMGSIWVAAACGDVDSVTHLLRKDKRLATQKGGPDEASPLLYLCFSRLNRGHEAEFAQCAELLLANGANPNETYIHPEYPTSPLSVLYGAAGTVFNPELVKVLLQRGAEVNDNESLYHSTESRNHDCLKLILGAKPKIEGTNALYRMLDFEDIEGLKLFIDAGADLNEEGKEGALNHAIRRGRSREHIELLIDSGADVTRLSDEGWAPYVLALRSSNLEAATLLKEKRLVQETTKSDALFAACLAEDVDAARKAGIKPKDLDPHELDAFIEAAWNGKLETVRTMLAVGFPVCHLSTKSGHTALHSACWKGYAEIVEVLLAHKAPVDITERDYQALPIGWACHGSLSAKDGDGLPLNQSADYRSVVKMLLAAGSPVPEGTEGSEEVNAVLRSL